MSAITGFSQCIVCGQEHMKRMFEYRSFAYWRCPQCAHVTTLPYPSTEQIVEHYRSGFADRNYRTVREHAETYRASMAQLLDLLARAYTSDQRNLQGASLLDIGCFTGEFLEEAQRHGVDGYGVELQEEAVAIASERLPNRVRQVNVMAEDLGFPHERFDIVTLLGVVEHVTDPLKLLRRAGELLKPGGMCFIQTPNSGTLFSTLMRKYWPPFAPIEHIHLFSRKSITQALLRTGFHDIDTRPHMKRLTPAYVYSMLQSFGPEFRPFAAPLYHALPHTIRRASLPFYIGEMVTATTRP